ncbi:hypothetical protein ACIRPT_24680 [Streptomyces sp. NPDC101227]|uniref:hypothetical protein n=1 Tax=Streptomyces sp. NPDC101227 TaxID=3366136 RepID=UPI0038251E2C
MSAKPRPEVGDVVRDQARDCEAIVTDIRHGVPLLRARHGSGEPWLCSPLSLEIVARRGEWVKP